MAHLFGAVIDDDGVIVKRRGVQDVSAPARELRLLLEAIDRAEVQLATYDDRTQHSAAHVALLRGRGELPAGEDHDADAELADEVNER
jgi:Mg-chelatase subunit ChlI